MNGAVTKITLDDPGAGYLSVPIVTIDPAPAPVLGLTISGEGSLSLPAANPSINGPANVNGGTLNLGDAGAGIRDPGRDRRYDHGVGALTLTNVVNFNNSQVAFAGSNPITFSSSSTAGITLTNNTTLTNDYDDNSSTVTTLASAITGSGSLTLESAAAASPGTFAITGQNSTGMRQQQLYVA